jgi:hypothetical protein
MKASGTLLIAFIVLAILLLGALSSGSSGCGREGVDSTLAAVAARAAPDPAVAALESRMTALEKSVKESKERISSGEAEANAAVGNLQMTLPS